MTHHTQPHIEIVRTAPLKPDPRNARTHSKKQITQIGASIKKFGWLVPIIADDDSMIAAGHGVGLPPKSFACARCRSSKRSS